MVIAIILDFRFNFYQKAALQHSSKVFLNCYQTSASALLHDWLDFNSYIMV